MSYIKYFPNIVEFDPKTNQVKVKDVDGNYYVAPLAFFGTIRFIDKYTPVIIIADDNYRTSENFPEDGKIKINAVAIPIYNESRFDKSEVGKTKIIGEVVNGKIQQSVEVGKNIIIKNSNEQIKVGPNKVELNNVQLDNPNISYGEFCEPQNFVLRFRPDFPYLLTEFMPVDTLFRKVGKIAIAFAKLVAKKG